MKHFLTLFLFVGITALSFGQTIVIENVNIVDVSSGEIAENQHVLISADEIVEISETEFINADIKINGKGKYLIPGLWDMHVHLSMIGETSLPLFVANGITGVRDMGGDWAKLKHWRALSANPEQSLLPVMKTAGPILESERFYGLLNKLMGDDFVKSRIPIREISQVDHIIDSVANLGVDFIKVRTASSPEIFYALLKSAQRQNIQISGHIDSPIKIDEAVSAGISTVEHDLFLQILSMSDADKKETLDLIGKKRPYFTPTLIATNQSRLTSSEEFKRLLNDSLNQVYELKKYISPSLIEDWKIEMRLKALESPLSWDSIVRTSRNFSGELASRTKLLSGTDVGVVGIYPGWDLHKELQNVVSEFQISPLKALQSATINAAECLQLANQYGTIQEGKKADLLLLTDNPLLDISNTQKMDIIFKNGVPIDISMRRELLSKIEEDVAKEKNTYISKKLQHLNTMLESMGF